jgi:hypothetical protein
VLEHPHAHHFVERALERAEVRAANLDAVLETGIGDALLRPRRVTLAERDAHSRDTVIPRGMEEQAAEAAADVHEPLARHEPQLLADAFELLPLEILEGVLAREGVAARVGHRVVEERLEEVVSEVVVAPYVAGVPAQQVGRPAEERVEREAPVPADALIDAIAKQRREHIGKVGSRDRELLVGEGLTQAEVSVREHGGERRDVVERERAFHVGLR